MFDAGSFHDLINRLNNAGMGRSPTTTVQAYHLLVELLNNRSKDNLIKERSHARDVVQDHLRPLFINSQDQNTLFDDVVSLWSETAEWGLGDKPKPEVGGGSENTGDEFIDIAPHVPTFYDKFQAWASTNWKFIGLIPATLLGCLCLFIIIPPTPIDNGPTISELVPIPFDPIISPNNMVEEGTIKDENLTSDPGFNAVIEKFNAVNSAKSNAATLRELHQGGVFANVSLERIAQRMGIAPDQPIYWEGDDWEKIIRVSEAAVSSGDKLTLSLNSPGFLRRTPEISVQDIVSNSFLKFISEQQQFFKSLSYSPDGRFLAMGNLDGMARIWDVTSGEIVSVLRGHEVAVWSVSYSPDGRFLATASYDNTSRVWDVATGEAVTVLEGHEGPVWSVSYSPDGRFLATGSGDGTARIWDVTSGETVSVLRGHEDWVRSVSYSPDGRFLATGSQDNTSRIWEIADGETVSILRGHAGTPLSISYSSDGRILATGSADGTTRVWDVTSGQTVSVLSGHDGPVYSISYSPDGRFLATGSGDGTARIWDVKGGETISVLRVSESSVESITYSPNGRLLTNGDDGTLLIWEHQSDFSDFLLTLDYQQTDVANLIEWAKGLPREKLEGFSLETASEQNNFARLIAAESYAQNKRLSIIDGDWLPSDLRKSLPSPYVVWFRTHYAWLVAGLSFLIGIVLWVWHSIHLRRSMQRNKAASRLIDLFSGENEHADVLNENIRKASQAMLGRETYNPRFNIRASLNATIRAGGLFTPVNKPISRLPEYLFLIDSRSRDDHNAKRINAYLDRLKKEHINFVRYFFERAPDRVRSEIGKPSVPLENILSKHSGKRLVIFGDAAMFLEPGRFKGSAWIKLLKAWRDKALLTSVPIKEWGREEKVIAEEAEMAIAPLSTEALSLLPHTFIAGDNPIQTRLLSHGSLRVGPLPSLLRRDEERLCLNGYVDDERINTVIEELRSYLDRDAWRWFCACAIYPILDWDVTMAIGAKLKGRNGLSIATETRIAELAELPWMKRGYIPEWLRGRLINSIKEDDEKVIRKFLSELFDGLSQEQTQDAEGIVLRFADMKGREMLQDEHFVEFALRRNAKSTPADLEATRKLEAILRPSLLTRLQNLDTLKYLGLGSCFGALAFLLLPLIHQGGFRITDWIPFFCFAFVIIAGFVRGRVFLFLQTVRSAASSWGNSVRNNSWKQWRRSSIHYVSTIFGYVSGVVRDVNPTKPHPNAMPAVSIGKMLRRRVVVLTIANIGSLVLNFFSRPSELEMVSVSAREATSTILSPVNFWEHWYGEILISIIFVLIILGALFASLNIARLMVFVGNKIADYSGQHHEATRVPHKSGIWTWISVLGGIGLVYLSGEVLNSAIDANDFSLVTEMFLLIALCYSAWTLNKYSRKLAGGV